MRKIVSLFQRNYESDRMIRPEVVPGAEWVLAGEGISTEKFDGTACLVRSGKLFKRYDAKRGKQPPPGWEAAQDPDPVTGHWPGWVAVGDGPEDRWFRVAWQSPPNEDGTYELVGPKINGNPHGLKELAFRKHGSVVLADVPRDFEGLRTYLETHVIEGIVWHHQDGRMVKLKARDYGLRWPR